MKLISLVVLSFLAYFLSSVQVAYAADTVALDFDLPSDRASTRSIASAATALPTPASESADRSEDALSFVPPAVGTTPDQTVAPLPALPASPKPNPSDVPDVAAVQSSSPSETTAPSRLFSGGSESLVARTVGHAEGTRAADGSKNPAYYGHSDPGNGVWNRGTFSYQFGNGENLSPEEADRRQLDKLQGHYQTIQRKAAANNLTLNLEESLNAIDLANQAPLAVTEAGGFVERLAEAKQEKQLTGEAAILEGRVWSYWDPKRGGWDAPGLKAYGANTEDSIRHDQDRRMHAIARALETYQQQLQPELPKAANKPHEEQVADLIISLELPN